MVDYAHDEAGVKGFAEKSRSFVKTMRICTTCLKDPLLKRGHFMKIRTYVHMHGRYHFMMTHVHMHERHRSMSNQFQGRNRGIMKTFKGLALIAQTQLTVICTTLCTHQKEYSHRIWLNIQP